RSCWSGGKPPLGVLRVFQCQESRMYEPLMDGGGIIRKLRIVEAERYREHLLRLDPESRRSRFGGAVSDGFILRYSEPSALTDAVIHGFFVDGVLRGAAELRPLAARPRRPSASSANGRAAAWERHC